MKRVWRLIYFKIFKYASMSFGSLNNLNVGQHELNKIQCSTSISRVKPYMFDCLPFIIVFVLFCQYTHLDKHSVHKTASLPDTYGYTMLLTLIFYAKHVNYFDWNFIYDDDINKWVENVTATILNLCKRFIPNHNVTIKPHGPKWITNEIKRLIRKRKRVYRKATQSNNHSDMQKFKKLRNNMS